MEKPKVSIIIPTYHDWTRLDLCIRALANQTYPAHLLEILVVNNAPGDREPEELKIPENCKIVEESKPGSYAARNRALRVCNGEIVGFTDSDCIPDKNWVRKAVERLESDDWIKRVGGAVHIFYKNDRPSKVELYDQIFAFPQEAYVRSGNAVTANMFTYKRIFEEIGYFNDSLMSGGDYKWGKLANSKGYPIVYAPEAIVKHPARPTVKDLLVKAKRVGIGQARFKKPVAKSNSEILRSYLRLFKPRLWEIRIIFDKGENISFFNKIYLVLLRHYVMITGDLYRLISEQKIRKRSVSNA